MLDAMNIDRYLVVMRGGGDLASAVAQKLVSSGFQVVIKDLAMPTMVRRSVSYASAVYEGTIEIEGITSRYIKTDEDAAITINKIYECLRDGQIPVVSMDEETMMNGLKPAVFIDGTISKKKPDYKRGYAPVVIGLGPEIVAGIDADVVIETNRGHDLGRLIFQGEASKSTGIPGDIGGFTKERILRAPVAGSIIHNCKLGDIVNRGDVVLSVDGVPVYAGISGMVRGLIHHYVDVSIGMKIGDIDPRGSSANHLTISDKGRNIAGGVLEAVMNRLNAITD